MTRPVLILGGGTAGISTLLWCQSLGLPVRLYEASGELGGQLLAIDHPILDYPGLVPVNGKELRDRLISQLGELTRLIRFNSIVTKYDLRERAIFVNGEWVQGSAIVLAMGVRQRRLGLKDSDNHIQYADIHNTAKRYQGQSVCVIGGGDSAIENALSLAKAGAAQVTLLHRRKTFRARPEWLSELRQYPNVQIVTGIVQAIGANDNQSGKLKVICKGNPLPLIVDSVIARIGVTPNTEGIYGMNTNSAGYIEANAEQCTSFKGVYAVGDICQPTCFSIANSVGSGANAAKSIQASFSALTKL